MVRVLASRPKAKSTRMLPPHSAPSAGPSAKNPQTFKPHIIIPPPGPKAKEVLAREEKYVTPSLTKVCPFVASHGKGVFLWDVDGNCFVDFVSGIVVNSLGHAHPRITEAIEDQSRKLLHYCGADYYYEPYSLLCEKLAKLSPGKFPKKVFLGNSGTEAVECAIKLARFATKRFHLIAFIGAFHGRTMGSLSLTASKTRQRAGFGPFGGVTHIPYPDAYRGRYLDRLEELENLIFKRLVPPEEVAAIIIEPIQGEGGFLVPPEWYLKRLREICTKEGILMIADEVQSGIGRTGKFCCTEYAGVEPDIICLAKGIANGLPLSATVARAELMSWPPGSHASTFGGNPVACRAALVVLEELQNGVMENCRMVGTFLLEQLRLLQKKHSLIGDVRGKGLMIGMELVKDRQTKEPAPEARDALVQHAFQRGLLLDGCGMSTIRLTPPLIIKKEEVEMGVKILDEVLEELGNNVMVSPSNP